MSNETEKGNNKKRGEKIEFGRIEKERGWNQFTFSLQHEVVLTWQIMTETFTSKKMKHFLTLLFFSILFFEIIISRGLKNNVFNQKYWLATSEVF
jgi:hypothetical protein